jgi:hypothetical protein
VRSDDILDQIDTALHDWSVSDDAMRSAPADTLERGPDVRMYLADEAGEWQELPGVAAVDIQFPTPSVLEEFAQQWADFIDRMTRQRVEQARRAQEAFEAFTRALTEPMKRSVEEATRAFETLQQTAQQEPPPASVRRRERPAWQSPYGPAQRRRR